jgi:hypothetical protein
MNSHAVKTSENKSQAIANSAPKLQANSDSSVQFMDNRPEAVAQGEMNEMVNNSPQVSQLKSFQEMVNNSPQSKQTAQLQTMADNSPSQKPQLITRQGEENTPEESERAKPRWGEIKSKVDESREFNSKDTRANVRAYNKEHPEMKGMVNSAGGAYLANQMNLKKSEDRKNIGPTEAYMGKKENENSTQSQHLNKFAQGGHAFISHWAHRKVLGMDADWNFEGWGQDANFVGTPSAAQNMVNEASKPGGFGLYHLEKKLGVADGNWVEVCKPIGYGIWRYHLKNPEALHIRMASGAENNAYSPYYEKEDKGGKFKEGEWVPKGKTLGGADEAVVDSLPRDKFFKAVANGSIQIELENSMQENTERELKEQKRDWKK